MESLDHLICEKRLRPSATNSLTTTAQINRRAMVQASLSTVFGRKGRHLTGSFLLTGDTMEGIIQCLVFLKAFSVSSFLLTMTFDDFFMILFLVFGFCF